MNVLSGKREIALTRCAEALERLRGGRSVRACWAAWYALVSKAKVQKLAMDAEAQMLELRQELDSADLLEQDLEEQIHELETRAREGGGLGRGESPLSPRQIYERALQRDRGIVGANSAGPQHKERDGRR